MPDPLWEKYYGWTPWQYCRNNPLRAVDFNGLDEQQRLAAIKFAESYIGSGSTYRNGEKGLPGKPVDCSGLVNNSSKAGDEPSLIGRDGITGTGVQQIEQVTKEIVDFNDSQEGNIITFRYPSNWPYHTGLITGKIYDENGKLKAFEYIHSSSSKGGPVKSIIDINSKFIHGIYKWDTKPDKGKLDEPILTNPSDTGITPSSGGSWRNFDFGI